MASNPRISPTLSKEGIKEEATMHQFNEEMEPMIREVEPESVGLEDVDSHYDNC
jgi:hypothetical protein